MFPTEVRLRAAGICNTFGRAATIATPFLVVRLFTDYGVVAVLTLTIGLLFVLTLTVATLGIEPRRRNPEHLGGGSVEAATIKAPTIAR